MGKSDELQTLWEGRSGMVERDQPSHYAPNEETRAEMIWTVQSPRSDGTNKFLPRAAVPSHWKIHNVFDAKLLHPYKETEEHGENFTEPPLDLIDGEPEWEVEQILDMRTQQSERQYLIC